jgi:hypothetical protein
MAIAVALMNLSGHQAAPRCPIRHSWHGDYYFPNTRGTLVEKTRNRKLSLAGHCGTEVAANFPQQEASQSVEPPQRASIPSKPRRLSIEQKSWKNTDKIPQIDKYSCNINILS